MKRKAVRIKARERRTNSGLRTGDADHEPGMVAPAAPLRVKRRALFGRRSSTLERLRERNARVQAKRQAAREANEESKFKSHVPPEWMAGHRFCLPKDAQKQHEAAKAAQHVQDHRVCWMDLRRVQAEDEDWVKAGHKKRMKWLSKSKHIDRTSFSALSVDTAMAVLSMSTADQLRLRRHGGW